MKKFTNLSVQWVLTSVWYTIKFTNKQLIINSKGIQFEFPFIPKLSLTNSNSVPKLVQTQC
jgi:hypothetical protein